MCPQAEKWAVMGTARDAVRRQAGRGIHGWARCSQVAETRTGRWRSDGPCEDPGLAAGGSHGHVVAARGGRDLGRRLGCFALKLVRFLVGRAALVRIQDGRNRMRRRDAPNDLPPGHVKVFPAPPKVTARWMRVRTAGSPIVLR